jgi:hypothetical protein
MNNEDRNEFADRLIDAALMRYSDAEPRFGLESRILANVRTQRAQARWRFGIGMAACAAVVILFVIGVAVMRRPQPSKTVAGDVSAAKTPVREAARAAIAASSHKATPGLHTRHRTTVARRTPEPRREQFPSPAPLSEQERLLIQYANATPKEELLTVITMQKAREEELSRRGQETNTAPAPEVNHMQAPLKGGKLSEPSANEAR